MWTDEDRRRLTTTPYADALERHTTGIQGNFHALPVGMLDSSDVTDRYTEQLARLAGAGRCSAELTLAGPVLDSIFSPRSCLARSQRLTAEAFGADKSFYVTTGTTTANQIAVEAIRQCSTTFVVDRNVHQSLHFAADRVAADVVYASAIAGSNGSVVGAVSAAVRQGVAAPAVILSAAPYDSYTLDLRSLLCRIYEAAQAQPIAVLIDEAWGSARYFHTATRGQTAISAIRQTLEEFPSWDIQALVTHSAHKSLLALRQGAYLHAIGSGSLQRTVQSALYRTHTSSPSLPILASLDIARAHAVARGEELLSRAMQMATRLRAAVRDIPEISETAGARSQHSMFVEDPTKVGVQFKDQETAVRAKSYLYSEYGLYVAQVTQGRIVFNIHMAVREHHVDALIDALTTFHTGRKNHVDPKDRYVIAYPPGIPLTVPGEVNDEAGLDNRALVGADLFSVF